MQKASMWESILLTVGRAQSSSSDDETRFIASHIMNNVNADIDRIDGEYNAIIDELNKKILELERPVSKDAVQGEGY